MVYDRADGIAARFRALKEKDAEFSGMVRFLNVAGIGDPTDAAELRDQPPLALEWLDRLLALAVNEHYADDIPAPKLDIAALESSSAPVFSTFGLPLETKVLGHWSDAERAIEQLASVMDLLKRGRAFGFAVTATPEAVAALRASSHPQAAQILANVVPVQTDSWLLVNGAPEFSPFADVEPPRLPDFLETLFTMVDPADTLSAADRDALHAPIPKEVRSLADLAAYWHPIHPELAARLAPFTSYTSLSSAFGMLHGRTE